MLWWCVWGGGEEARCNCTYSWCKMVSGEKWSVKMVSDEMVWLSGCCNAGLSGSWDMY